MTPKMQKPSIGRRIRSCRKLSLAWYCRSFPCPLDREAMPFLSCCGMWWPVESLLGPPPPKKTATISKTHPYLVNFACSSNCAYERARVEIRNESGVTVMSSCSNFLLPLGMRNVRNLHFALAKWRPNWELHPPKWTNMKTKNMPKNCESTT